ncbi:MAG: hypothetical protein MUF07_06075 [Steroidobacteraceae bacterium]|jgi:hypothetical protein|nr:hypothetical protein [Steroidobacteraceae bacterium]
MQTWPLEQLRCGDLLLSQGNFHLSRMMAWNAECPYSHAAIMVAPDAFAEARPPRVQRRLVTDLLAARDRLRFVDVWRPLNPDGSELSALQRRQVAEVAGQWLDWPFASYAKMGWLALQTLVRHKLGAVHWRLPAPRDVGVSCTEFVCRVLQQVLPLQLAPRVRDRSTGRPAHLRALEPHAVITVDLCSTPAVCPLGRLELLPRARTAREPARCWMEVTT